MTSPTRTRSQSSQIGRVARHVDALLDELGAEDERSPWLGMHRSPSHVVYDSTGAASPSGEFKAGKRVAEPLPLPEVWTEQSLPILRASTFVAVDEGDPWIPSVSTAPTPGQQVGEKQDTGGTAFEIDGVRGTEIKSSYTLNLSQQLLSFQTMSGEVIDAVQRSAVAHHVDGQIVAEMTTAGNAVADWSAAFAAFGGSRWTPTTIVVPPSAFDAAEVERASVLGMRVVLDTNATKPMVVDPRGTLGWLNEQPTLTKVQPSVLGREQGLATWGRMLVEPQAVQVIG